MGRRSQSWYGLFLPQLLETATSSPLIPVGHGLLARLLLPTAAWCGLLAACAAQDPAALTVLEDTELTESLNTVVEEEAALAQEPGPGYRWFVRGMVGSDAEALDDIYRSPFDPLVETVNQRFSTLTTTETTRYNAIALSALHMWDGDWGLINRWPALRVQARWSGALLELGQLPVAERAPLLEPGERDSRKWYERFVKATYISYGLSVVEYSENFRFGGLSDVTGRFYTSTTGKNTLTGPRFSVGQVVSNGRWSFDLGGSLLLGYVDSELNQENGFGDDAVPGGLNNVLFVQPTRSTYGEGQSGFASHIDLRLTTSYYLRHNWSIDGTAGLFVGGPYYTEPGKVVQYRMPDFGIGAEDNEGYVSGATLFLGATYLR